MTRSVEERNDVSLERTLRMVLEPEEQRKSLVEGPF